MRAVWAGLLLAAFLALPAKTAEPMRLLDAEPRVNQLMRGSGVAFAPRFDQPPGQYTLNWSARGSSGAALPRMAALGASLVAILPQQPDVSWFTAEGKALPDLNGDDTWELPVPATFVLGTDGTVALAFVEADHRLRLKPDEIIRALERLPS